MLSNLNVRVPRVAVGRGNTRRWDTWNTGARFSVSGGSPLPQVIGHVVEVSRRLPGRHFGVGLFREIPYGEREAHDPVVEKTARHLHTDVPSISDRHIQEAFELRDKFRFVRYLDEPLREKYLQLHEEPFSRILSEHKPF